jgi:hypothetical protein
MTALRARHHQDLGSILRIDPDFKLGTDPDVR